MWPLVILATCNTGDFLEHAYNFWSYTERFLYHSNGGAIGAIGTGGATHTYYNNIYSAGCIRGLLAKDIHYSGWVLMNGKLDLYRNYFGRGDIQHPATHEENWLTHTYVYNLMGDPAVDLYTAVPRALVVQRPQGLRAGETHVAINVAYDQEEEDPPAEGVTVCLYRAGVFQQKTWTDENGDAEFDLNPEWTRDGTVQLTVTGHNLMPVLANLQVAQAETFIGANGFTLYDRNGGDGDGLANPTEFLVLAVPIRNFGAQAVEGELTAVLTTGDPTLNIFMRSAQFDAAPEPGGTVIATFVVEIGGAHPHGRPAVFNLNVTVGENTWRSSVSVPVTGPEFKFVRFNWINDPLGPGGVADLTVTIRNTGTKNAPALNATLHSRTQTINAPVAQGQFAALNVDANGTSQAAFRLSAHPFHLRSIPAELYLVLQSQAGFIDTVDFRVNLNPAERDEPVGPDRYGYVAFDEFDENWFQAPQFDWIEIDSRLEGPGQNLNLVDRGMNQDVAVRMDLPFVFQYYGQEFNQVTIFSNGYIAMGAQEWAIEKVNRFIPGGLVVPGMIAPFWDDLVNGNNGAIFTWFNEDEHYFVVEWSRMLRLMGGQSPEETFQVILYDPEFHPNFTGDGDILFQYLNIRDLRDTADALGDTPYATVGIGSPDMSDGLQYLYWHSPSPGADTLANERAIKFTTMLTFDTAYLHGQVTDAATGFPMEGVLVQCTYGFWDITDAEGMWEMPDILVDTSSAYTLTASKLFYNDSSITDIRLQADDALEFDFALLHPEFTLDFEGIDVAIEQNNVNDFWIPIQNTGNGPLTFNSRIEFRNPNRDNLWDRFLSLNITNAPVAINGEDTIRVGNTWITGAAFVDSLFYVTGGGSERQNLPAKVYRFDRNGAFVDSLNQPWVDSRGIRGLCYDGECIWGALGQVMYKFNKDDMSIIDSFATAPSIPSDVTIDRENGILFICGITTAIFAYDYQGNLLNSWTPRWNGGGLRKYGLAWYPDQPDSLKMMIYADIGDTCGVLGFNPATGDVRFMINLAIDARDGPLGIDVTDRWNSSVWTFIATNNHGDGDRLSVYELEPNTTWLSYEPISGMVDAERDTMLHIRVEAGERPFDRYWVYLCYTFNAAPGARDIPVQMRIVEQSRIEDAAEAPLDFALKPNWPNPFNPTTIIRYSIPIACHVRLDVFDTQGRLVAPLVEGTQTAGEHQVRFDATGLPNGVYVYRLRAGDAVTARKMVLIK
ncbi:MAG: C25 family cysteine peptidase, partial [Calditrichota bacterium]